LSSEGFKLMSPSQPQPEKNIYEGKASEPVKYYFDLIRG
jgi:hypothetical protein